MQGHTRKHHIEEYNSPNERPYKTSVSNEAIDWRSAAEEVFGELHSSAINLKGLRNREGLTQLELGKAIGVEQSNISKMERGERQIGVKIAKRLEKVFNIDYRFFL